MVLLLVVWGLQPSACAQNAGAPASVANAPFTTQQVVENLVGRNLERAQALLADEGTRIYRVAYRGFPEARDAEMIVDVKYRAPGTKEFTIRSANASKLIIDKVFRKLLEAEQEALAAEAKGAPPSTATIMISPCSGTKPRPPVQRTC
jgi:hypothetical protein